jgi:hypothetical protein
MKHYNTPFPDDAEPDGYFVWKWKLGQLMERIIDLWASPTDPGPAGRFQFWTSLTLGSRQGYRL